MLPSRRRSIAPVTPALPHWIPIGVIAVALVTALFRWTLLDGPDPFRCGALLKEGQWLAGGQAKNWQPNGCMLHSYAPSDISTCLSSRRVIFIGDSVTRQLFFSVAHASDPSLPSNPINDERKHVDHILTSKDHTEFSFVWDPFLNSTRTRQLLQLPDGVNASSPYVSNNTPALMVIGSGLWFLRYADSSGGLQGWEAAMDHTLELMARAGDRLADTIVFLPVENLVFTKLSLQRASTMHKEDIDAMNVDLKHRIDALSINHLSPPSRRFRRLSPRSKFLLPEAFNRMLDPAQTSDGLHYSDQILLAQANVLFNFRCNDVLPKEFPLDKTCCRSYPSPSFNQILIIAFLVSWGLIVRFAAAKLSHRPELQALFSGEDHVTSLSTFGLGILLIFIADRTPIWLKEHKQFNMWLIGVWTVSSLVAGLSTIKRADKDLGFLNREQTDEWKGWMQIAILIYHYFGASKISGIYNPIRVLVASYLFISGYGHTTFFIKKADYSLRRISQVLVRLNLLTIALAYAMNTNYLFYYFSPLVSMWFLIIYATMVIGKDFNDRSAFLVFKCLLSMALFTLVINQDWFLEELFIWLDRLCKIRWSAREWAFRVKLDLWIVYFGMLSALAHIKFRELQLIDHSLWPLTRRVSIGLSVAVLLWFFMFELSQPSKFTYNAWHPYISILPIGAFVILRNSNAVLRSASSRVFAFIGTCSLETFIIQYHFWMAADTKGILVVIPGTKWRPLNMLVCTIMFIWLSHKVAYATGKLTDWFCGTAQPALPPPITSRILGIPDLHVQTEGIPLTNSIKNEDSGSQPSGPSEGRDNYVATEHRPPGFRTYVRSSSGLLTWQFGVGTRLAATGLVLWLLNITWPS